MRQGDGTPAIRLALARAALAWERLWPAIWPAVGVAGGFLALALFNLLPALPAWAHFLVLVGFAGAFGFALWRGIGLVRWPAQAEALRRLERDSGLRHRPLHAVRDTLSDGADPLTLALWHEHRARMAAQVRALRVHWPSPGLPARDPWAVRAAVGLILFVAAAGSWGDWLPRLGAALTPHLSVSAGITAAALDVWLTPPEYTGLPPIFLKTATDHTAPAGSADPIAVPIGSTVLARVTGGAGVPVLSANGSSVDFTAIDGSHFQISQPVTRGDQLAVEQGGVTIGRWPLTIRLDQPPTIEFAEPPAATDRFALKLDYQLSDDYGVVGAVATIRRAASDPAAAMPASAIELPLTVPGSRPRQAHGTSFQDLTAHPWAGLPVMIRLTATDGAGQRGRSEEVATVLPERAFRHPVARAIIAVRKELSVAGDPGRSDGARALSELSRRPGEFRGDVTVFLALRVAVGHLLLDRSPEAVTEVQSLLWETALRVEEGQVPLAERELREAERALAEALDRNAGDEELRRLMDELQAALDKYLDALEEQMRQAIAQGRTPPELPPELQQQMLDRGDLQSMIDRMRDMTETGARDGARQMLSQLQQMLENLRSGASGGAGQQQGMELMRELQQLTEKQRQLLDQTYQQSQAGTPDSQTPGQRGGLPRGRGQGRSSARGNTAEQAGSSADQQSLLRRQLGDLMRRLGEGAGEIPAALGNAERAMRDAEQALGLGQPDAAVPPQSQAVDQLQQGLRNLALQMADQSGMGMGNGTGRRPQSGRGRDPLGRPTRNFGAIDRNEVRIPEQGELQRAREILEELRRRAGEFARPRLELDYIDRLLRRF